jgi:Ca2+-binding RTX toxin-like protein
MNGSPVDVQAETVAIYDTTIIEDAVGGNAADTIIGNVVANRLSGLGGNDTLRGDAGADRLDGGAGNDSLVGGSGNDSYIVNSTGDKVTELAGGGSDLVQSSVSITALATNVEKLTLTGSGNTNGAGNTLANTITGNAGANVLSGLSGNDKIVGGGGADRLAGDAGKDTLTGSAGNDKFDFDTALNAATNVDRISDFSSVNDTIRLDNDIFTAFGAVNVTLAAGAFYKGAGVTDAHDATDRIIYDTSSGNLCYDPDGTGAADATLFATLAGTPGATASDFFIIG